MRSVVNIERVAEQLHNKRPSQNAQHVKIRILRRSQRQAHEKSTTWSIRPARHAHLSGHHDLRPASQRGRSACHSGLLARSGHQLHRHRRDVRCACHGRYLRPDRNLHWQLVCQKPRRAPEAGAGHQSRGPLAKHALGARGHGHDGTRHPDLVRRQFAPPADRCDRPVPDPLARAPCDGPGFSLFRPERGQVGHLHP